MRSRSPTGPALLLGLVLLVATLPMTAAARRPAPGADDPSEVAVGFDTRPARAALVRLLGDRAARQIQLVAADPAGPGDRFEVRGRDGHIVVEGTSNATLLTGVNWYLKRVVGAGITWNGDALDRLPAVLPAPDEPISEDTPYEHRFAGNDTVTGYTGPYWTWPD